MQISGICKDEWLRRRLGGGGVFFRTATGSSLLSGDQGWLPLLVFLVVCLALVKLLDLVLSIKKGIAIVVVAFSLANAAIVLFVAEALLPTLASKCPTRYLQSMHQLERLLGVACANLSTTINVVAMGAFALTILAYWSKLRRGIKDVGFIANSLRAERQRHQGI